MECSYTSNSGSSLLIFSPLPSLSSFLSPLVTTITDCEDRLQEFHLSTGWAAATLEEVSAAGERRVRRPLAYHSRDLLFTKVTWIDYRVSQEEARASQMFGYDPQLDPVLMVLSLSMAGNLLIGVSQIRSKCN